MLNILAHHQKFDSLQIQKKSDALGGFSTLSKETPL